MKTETKAGSANLCLVTGGAGFIGSHVVDGLLKEGCRVRVLDDLSTGKRENLNGNSADVELIVGDIRDPGCLRKALEGVDYVFHLAAVRAVLRSVDNPMETHDVNVTALLALLSAAKEAGVKRLIFSSSSSVYGDGAKFPSSETDRLDPQSPYAASKAMGEYYARIFSSLYGLETVCLRYFNVFGPRQNPESRYSAVIPIFIDQLLKNQPPEVHWDGKQSRDFCYVDNVVEGNILAMKTTGIAGEVFNIACHDETSVLDILNHLKRILGVRDLKPVFHPKRAGDVRRTFADIRKTEHLMGFRVKTRLAEGLQRTVEWFLKQASPKEIPVHSGRPTP